MQKHLQVGRATQAQRRAWSHWHTVIGPGPAEVTAINSAFQNDVLNSKKPT